jgi:hypothetical protein
VDARDGLHAPAVAVREPHAVDGLRAADVGAAVAAQRNLVVGRQLARHARAPEDLVAIPLRQRAVDHLVDEGELLQHRVDARARPGDELKLTLAEIRGDVRMRERRAERGRMRRGRERSVGTRAQALLLDAAAHGRYRGRRE